jgi:hypothetical protein
MRAVIPVKPRGRKETVSSEPLFGCQAAFREIAAPASSGEIFGTITAALADGRDVVNVIGRITAIRASPMIALEHESPKATPSHVRDWRCRHAATVSMRCVGISRVSTIFSSYPMAFSAASKSAILGEFR